MSEFTITRNGNQRVIAPVANLTAASIPDLQAALLQEIKEGGVNIVLNFSTVHMLDSSGIGLLVATFNSATKAKGSLRIEQVSKEIYDLLQTMRLISRLNVTGQTTAEVGHGR